MTRIRLVWLISAMFTIGNSIKLRRLTAGICPELFGLRLRERMTDANELPIAVSVVAAPKVVGVVTSSDETTICIAVVSMLIVILSQQWEP